MKFTSQPENVRSQRSNDGAEALARSVLQHLLGLTKPTVDNIMQTLQETGEASMMRQNLKLLSLVAHTRLNQILDQVEKVEPSVSDDIEDDELDDMIDAVDDVEDTAEMDFEQDDQIDGPDDPDNVNIMQHASLRHSNNPWTPEQDREEEREEDDLYPSVADPEDYRIEGRRMTFLSFLSEMSREAQIDTAISQMQDEEDDKLDPAVKRKIDQAEARGDGKKASMLRQQAKRRNRLSTPQEPKTPTQQRVEQKKKELADAIRRDKNTPGDE